MAIPFVMPGEEPEDNLDQLIIQLSDIIIQIQLLLRERARRQMMERRNRGKFIKISPIFRISKKFVSHSQNTLCVYNTWLRVEKIK